VISPAESRDRDLSNGRVREGRRWPSWRPRSGRAADLRREAGWKRVRYV